MELIWPAVTLVVAALAYRATTRALAPDSLAKRLAKVEQAVASLPAAEDFLGRIDALEAKLAEATSPVKMVGIVNAHTKDMVELKGMVAGLRTDVLRMRTGAAVLQTATGG